jgi:hypothetical protein
MIMQLREEPVEAVEKTETPQLNVDAVVDKKEDVKPKEETLNNSFIPIDNDVLPTKGIFYGGRTLYGRTLKVIELKKLSNVTEADAVKTVDDIMSKVIKGVDWDDIRVSDKQALIFWVRCNTFRDPRFTIQYKCNLETDEVNENGEKKICNTENKMSFSIEDLEFEYIQEDKVDSSGRVTMNLPFSGDEIVWEYPTNKDVTLIEANYKKLKQIAKVEGIDEPDYALVSYAYIIKSINGDSDRNIASKYSYIAEELSSADYMYIESTMEDDFACGVNQNVKTVCKECGGQVEVPVMFSEQFFNPAFTK